MGSPRFILVVTVLGICQIAWTQSPTLYGVGRTPTAQEIAAWDIAVSPTGKRTPARTRDRQGRRSALPFGRGARDATGAKGSSGGHAPTLIKGAEQETHASMPMPCLAPCVNDLNNMSVHSPFATAIWDYIHRGTASGAKKGRLVPMRCTPSPPSCCSRTVLFRKKRSWINRVCRSVKMPNHDGFGLPPEWKHGTPRLQGYP